MPSLLPTEETPPPRMPEAILKVTVTGTVVSRDRRAGNEHIIVVRDDRGSEVSVSIWPFEQGRTVRIGDRVAFDIFDKFDPMFGWWDYRGENLVVLSRRMGLLERMLRI